MLKERYGFSADNGKRTIITVDEILKSYEIKGLSLEDLQEKYVNIVDEYEERIKYMDDKYEELNYRFLTLSESIEEIKIEDNKYDKDKSQINYFLLILIIGIVISFFIGKHYKRLG